MRKTMKFIALSLGLFFLNSFASQNNNEISILNKTNYAFDLQYNGKSFAQKIEPRKYHSLKTGLRSSQRRDYIALIWHENNNHKEFFFAQSNINTITIDHSDELRITVEINTD